MNVLILQSSPRAKGNTVWMAEAEVLVLASPIYYFTLDVQMQAPIQRMYCVNKPAKVKKMALMVSSYSPNVYDGVTAEFRDICNCWEVEKLGVITSLLLRLTRRRLTEQSQRLLNLWGKYKT